MAQDVLHYCVDTLDDELTAAKQRYVTALAEFTSMSSVVVDALKSNSLTDALIEREARAREELMRSRDLVKRLTRLRDLARPL